MILASCPLEGRSGHEAAWALLEALYAREVGGPLPRVARTDRGKPYFVDSPWHFSVSHTPRRAFVALARENIGIDAEEADRPLNPRLAQKLLSPAEYARWQAAPDRNAALLRLWVQKEAAAKLAGTGLQGYPNHTDFDPDSPAVQETEGCFLAILTEKDTIYAV